MVEDVVYIAKHKSVFNPFKKVSNSEVKEIGKHTGKLIADVASAIIAGKLVSSFSKSKVGQKIIKKLKMKKGKKTKAPSTSTPKPNNTRINVANGRTRYTPKRANGNYVSAGMEHIISGHFNRALGNSRSIFSISIDKLKKYCKEKTLYLHQFMKWEEVNIEEL